MAKTQTNHVDIDYTNQAVPSTARKGFGAMFVIMLGFTFFSASMWTGVDLANGLDLNGFIWATSAATPVCPLTCWPAARSATRAPTCPLP